MNEGMLPKVTSDAKRLPQRRNWHNDQTRRLRKDTRAVVKEELY